MDKHSFDNLPEAVAKLTAEIMEIKSILLHKGLDADSNQEELFTVDECAKFLSISKQTVYKHVSSGELPVLKKSKRNYFLKSDLIEYLKTGRKKSHAEIEEEAIELLIKTKK